MKLRALPPLVAVAAILVATLPVQRISAQPAPPVPSVAPGYRAPSAEPSPPHLIGILQQPFVGIALQDAVAMALLKNPNLAVSATNMRIARYAVVQAKGPFDVHFSVEPASNYSVQPPENIFFAGPGIGGHGYTCIPFAGGSPQPCSTTGPGNIIQHQYNFQYGFNGQAVNGTQYSIGFTRTRTYNNTIINTFNPYYQASLNLSVTEPLLRNGGMNSAKRQLKLYMLGADAGEAQTLEDASNAIAQVEDSYWNLVAAWRNVAIQEEALNEAIVQQHSVVRIARQGGAAPVQAVEVGTQVATFQANVASALETVADLQNQLKSLIVADPGDPLWQANLVPSSPVQLLPSAGDLDTIVAQGERNRPEMRQAVDQRKAADLDHAYAKNQLLPQADLQVTYESNGAAGLLAPVPNFEALGCNNLPTGCPTPPPQSQGKMQQAIHNMWTAAYPTFNIALNFSVPLDNTFARALFHSSQEEQDQAALLIQGVDKRIGMEARNALQTYQSALSRLYAARTSREAAESVYASEVRRFNAGGSTTFLVLQRQTELAAARGRELQAQTDLNKAVVELQRVEGTILSANGVNLETLGSKALTTTP